ncbi:MAG TPA: hypothetical protein VEH76_12275 [Methylocystis sp.]|nr:hypothetical protein [Methylocystis sp.]
MMNGETSENQEETNNAVTATADQAAPAPEAAEEEASAEAAEAVETTEAVVEEAPAEAAEASAETTEAVAEEAPAEAAEASAETIEAVAQEAPAEAEQAPAETIEAVAQEAPAEEVIAEPVTSLDDVKRAMRFGEVLGHTLASLHATLARRGVAGERASELANRLTDSVIRSISHVLEGSA